MGLIVRRSAALAAASILLAASCGTQVRPVPATRSVGPASASPGPSAAPSAAPAASLVVAVANDPVSFTVAGDDATSQRVVPLLFRSLYRPNAQLAMVPDLAAAPPQVSADGLTWTVQLRPEARWQDGTPITSADVVFTYAMAESPDCRLATSVCATAHAVLNSVSAPDPETVVFHLAQPSASFLADALGQPIFPEAAVQASFTRFTQALGTLDAKAVAATNQQIADAMAQASCLAASPPSSCQAGSYVTQLEAVLNRPGIAAPEPGAVTAYGPLTTEAYGLELIGALGDLVTALDAQGTDRLAASFRLLDFQRAPLGSGLYRLANYQPGKALVLQRVGAPAGSPGASPSAAPTTPAPTTPAPATPGPTRGATAGPAASGAPTRSPAPPAPTPSATTAPSRTRGPGATGTPSAVPSRRPTPSAPPSPTLAPSGQPGATPVGQPGAGAPQQIVFRIMPDPNVAAAALQRGEVQWVPDLPPEVMPALQADPALQVATYPTSSVTYLAFNVRKGRLFYDVNLRRAVAECIDLPQAVHDATGADGVPLRGFVSPASWAYDRSLPAPTYDPAAARKLIQASGWRLGADGVYVKGTQRLAATLWVRQGTSPRVGFAGLAAQQLRACGFDITVQEADLLGGILPRLSYPNDFDLYLGVRQMSLDPNDDAPLFLSSHIPSQSNPDDANIAGWHDPLTDSLFAEAERATDAAQRASLYAQLQQRLGDYIPYLFLWADEGHAALARRVTADGAPLDLSSPLYDWNLDAWTLAGP